MNRHARRWLLPVGQAVVTAAVLAWIFSHGETRREMSGVLRAADWRWVLAGLVCGGINEAVGAVRWGIFLRMQGIRISWRRTLGLHFIGLFTTLFLPGSVGGDAVKAGYLMRDVPDRAVPALASVLMDRVSGVVAMFVSALVPLTTRAAWFATAGDVRLMTQGVLVMLAAIGTGFVLWWATSLPIMRNRHPRWLPHADKLMELSGLFDTMARGWRYTLAAVLMSFVSLYAYFLIFYCAARAVGAGVGLKDMLSILPVMNVVTLLPVTIAGVGLREKTIEPLLRELCGVPSATGYLVSILGFGLYAAWSLGGAPVLAFYRRHGASHDSSGHR